MQNAQLQVCSWEFWFLIITKWYHNMPVWAYFILRQQYFTFPKEIFHFPVRENIIGQCGNPFPHCPLAPGFLPHINDIISQRLSFVNRLFVILNKFYVVYKIFLFTLYNIPSCNFPKDMLLYSHKRWYQCTSKTSPNGFNWRTWSWICFPSRRRLCFTALTRMSLLKSAVKLLIIFQIPNFRIWSLPLKPNIDAFSSSFPDDQVDLTLRCKSVFVRAESHWIGWIDDPIESEVTNDVR